jgi:hypothetical protein
MLSSILVIDVRTSLFSSFDKVKQIIFAKFYPSDLCPIRMVMLDHKKPNKQSFKKNG